MWILMEERSYANDNGENGQTFCVTPIRCSESFDMLYVYMMAYVVELGTQGFSAEPMTDNKFVRLRNKMYVRNLYLCETESL